ncbi:DUF3027 domain-containing protein [Nocardia sp. NPDC058379]|uniref:DUF3027 domain-containing protein n=1 Tax=unclassified Nocardia TaxID=2637762 RepID=UPI003659EA98
MSAVSVSESGVRPVLADAAEVARRALVELEPDGVGAHLGVSGEDESAATHRFEATLPGYRGWQWAVVVAAPPEATYATVSESALLPGPDALIAPDFIPWEQRVRPGDLGPGDLLAPPADDPRLVPGYIATGDPVVDEVCHEIGLGRTQVLSLEGRVEAAQRWYTEFGPDTEMAKAAPSTCGLCGFFLPLAGALRESFGVCGNAMGADGHVVHIEYGCGAHSDVIAPSGNGSPRYEAFDDHAVELVEIVRTTPEPVPSAEVAEAAAIGEAAAPAEAVATAEAAATVEAGEAAAESAEVSVADVATPAVNAATTVDTDAATDAAAVETGENADQQETAEAEAVDAATAARAALAEGAQPESAAEVVAAEPAPTAEAAVVAETVTEAPSGATEVDTTESQTVATESTTEAAAETVPAADAAEIATSNLGAESGPAAETQSDAETVGAESQAAAADTVTEVAEDAAEVAEDVAPAADAAGEDTTAATASGAESDAVQGDSVDEHGSSVAR